MLQTGSSFDVTPAVALHAPYTVSPEWMIRSKELAEREDVPILMHIAETRKEAALILRDIGAFPEGKSVIEYLDELGFLSDRLIAAHVIHVDDRDIALLKQRGVGVAHNPKANKSLPPRTGKLLKRQEYHTGLVFLDLKSLRLPWQTASGAATIGLVTVPFVQGSKYPPWRRSK